MARTPPTALLLVAALLAPAPVLGAEVEPSTVLEGYSARIVGTGGVQDITWRAGDSYALTTRAGAGTRTVRAGGRDVIAIGGRAWLTIRRPVPVAPDGWDTPAWIDPSVPVLLAHLREGTAPLTAGSRAGRATWSGTVALGPDACTGAAAGVKSIEIDAATLLPLRVRVDRPGSRATVSLLRDLRTDPPARRGELAAPAADGSTDRRTGGFRRTAPAEAATHLPYAPSLPAALPSGFALRVSGWAPRSRPTGAGTVVPARPGLFAAVYVRGVERIVVTQRAAAGADWEADPYGDACERIPGTPASVGGVPAVYAAGGETVPHLYWRAGEVLHTISGPYPAATLVAVAESLVPVTG